MGKGNGVSKPKLCPLIGTECSEHECKFFVNLKGQNPQTGVIEDEWDCTFVFWPILLIENSRVQRETGAAVESFRNEMVKQNGQIGAALLQAANPRLSHLED